MLLLLPASRLSVGIYQENAVEKTPVTSVKRYELRYTIKQEQKKLLENSSITFQIIQRLKRIRLTGIVQQRAAVL